MNQDSKPNELTDEDLQQVSGGATVDVTTQQKLYEVATQECATVSKTNKTSYDWNDTVKR